MAKKKERGERGRFSAKRKRDAVLRIIKGEPLDALSRELGVTAATLSQWYEQFLAAGEASLKSRKRSPEEDELLRLKAKVGELTLDLEAAEALLELSRREGPFRPWEVEEVSSKTSPSLNVRFGISRVARLARAARSSIYFARAAKARPEPPRKRGPRTLYSDAELLALIREVLSESPFVGEGHRKVWAQLRVVKGIRTSLRRVLRLMRENALLAPVRARRVLGPQVHDGTIVTEMPNEMWGTDLTSVMTLEEGQAAVFVAVDHCTAECVGIHASSEATRFEALEPIRQGVREQFGSYEAGIAKGLSVRHDHGSQYVSDHFQGEIRFLGAESSPAFVRSPEGNGCAERFIRTLKEQLLWVRAFRTVEDLRVALLEWRKLYNERWLIQRHGHRSPAAVRRELLETQMAA